MEQALEPAHELRLRHAHLGLGGHAVERRKELLELLLEVRAHRSAQFLDRPAVDLDQALAPGVVRRGVARLLEQLPDHRREQLRRLGDRLAGRPPHRPPGSTDRPGPPASATAWPPAPADRSSVQRSSRRYAAPIDRTNSASASAIRSISATSTLSFTEWIAERVHRAPDQDLDPRERGGEHRHERDRSAGAHLDRVAAVQRQARRAPRAAGVEVSSRWPWPVLPPVSRSNVTSTPRARARAGGRSASRAANGSSPGATRRLTRARATGTIGSRSRRSPARRSRDGDGRPGEQTIGDVARPRQPHRLQHPHSSRNSCSGMWAPSHE